MNSQDDITPPRLATSRPRYARTSDQWLAPYACFCGDSHVAAIANPLPAVALVTAPCGRQVKIRMVGVSLEGGWAA